MNKKLLMIGQWFGMLISIPVIGLILFIVPMLWKIPIHNMQIVAFQRNFAKVSHPEGTTYIAAFKDFGNFGNSNHCDYFVGEFRSSDLPRNVVVSYYQKLRILSPNASEGVWSGEPHATTAVDAYFLDDEVFHYWPWSDWVDGHASRLPENTKNVYLAFASEDGYSPTGDFRCH